MKDLPTIRPIWPVKRPDPFDDPNWVFDLKYDGDRGVLYFDGKRIQFLSKHDKVLDRPWLAKKLVRHLEGKVKTVIFDGEIVCLGDNGWPVFADLREHRKCKKPLSYIAFDLLWQNGEDLRETPLEERRRRLYELLPNDEQCCIRPVLSTIKNGKKTFELIQKVDLEGMVAKRLCDPYRHPKIKWYKILNPNYSQKDKSKWFRHF